MNSLSHGDVRVLQKRIICCVAERYVGVADIGLNNKRKVPVVRDGVRARRSSNALFLIIEVRERDPYTACPLFRNR